MLIVHSNRIHRNLHAYHLFLPFCLMWFLITTSPSLIGSNSNHLLFPLSHCTSYSLSLSSTPLSGFADIIGRRFGSVKLPYNPSKSYAGSLAMAVAGFTASIGSVNHFILYFVFFLKFSCLIKFLFRYMFYFSAFGFMEATWGKALGFLVVSLAATAVESLPISTELDDNLTVPLTSFIVGSLIF